jgi:hypothetical protein
MTERHAQKYSHLYSYLYSLVDKTGLSDVHDLTEDQKKLALDLFTMEADQSMVMEMTQEIDRSLANTILRFVRLPQGENIGKLQTEITQHFFNNISNTLQEILNSVVAEHRTESPVKRLQAA